MTAFKQAMKYDGQSLARLGGRHFDVVRSKLQFMGKDITMAAHSIDDDWYLRFRAAVKTVGVNGKFLIRTPWEELTVEPGAIADMPAFCEPPEAEIRRIEEVRKQIRTFLKGVVTISEMRRIMKLREARLRELDDSVDLDLEYLHNHVESIVRQKVHAKALDVLPDIGAKGDFKQALKLIFHVFYSVIAST